MRASRTHGFTLLEVMVALGVLAIGGLATLQLIGVLINGNQNMSAVTDATALANRLAAEISDARFIHSGARDPGLNPATVGQLYTAPVTGSSIRTVGDFQPGSFDAITLFNRNALGIAKYRISYFVTNCEVCQTPTAGATGLGGIEVLIQVENALVGGPLLRPIQMTLRKEYTSSAVLANQVRGY